MRKIRLFVAEKNLHEGSQIKVSGRDFEYLTKVMRQEIEDKIFIFNGVDGEFAAVIVELAKKFLTLEIIQKISDLKKAPNVTLGFALLKNVGVDFIAEKATELGVANFQPLTTQHTISDKINLERFQANVKEACEQCERNDFPQIFPLQKLDKFLEEKDSAKKNRDNEINQAITARSDYLIDYTTFGELADIIVTNWDLFGDMFTKKEAVQKTLRLLNTLRGPIAHCCPLDDHEVLRLQLTVRDWFNIMS